MRSTTDTGDRLLLRVLLHPDEGETRSKSWREETNGEMGEVAAGVADLADQIEAVRQALGSFGMELAR